jgi:hypothetical protein
MDSTSQTHATQDVGSGTAGQPGVAYDTERLAEPGDLDCPRVISIPAMNAATSKKVVMEALVLTTSREPARLVSLPPRNRSPHGLRPGKAPRWVN